MSEFEQFLERKRFALLDGVRAIAILAVLWHHSGGESLLTWSLVHRGYLGVDLFFVLSGFLITHLLIKEHRTRGRISLKDFYARRTLRIFPLYYGYLLFVVTWAALTDRSEFQEMLPPLPYYLLYISNWMPQEIEQFFHRAWSLAVEEQFYLVWPAMMVVLGLVRSAWTITVLMLLSLLCILGVFGPRGFEVSQLLVPYRTIFIGCLIAILLNREKSYLLAAAAFRSRWVAPAVFVALLVFIALQSGPIVGWAQLIVHLLMAAFLVACLLNEHNLMSYFMTLRWVQLLGVVSYGVYILHGQMWGPTAKLLTLIPGSGWESSRVLFFILFTVLSLAVAYVSFNTYEKFFLTWKKRFERK